MSAWLVDCEHIDTMVTAALAWELAVPEKADEIGRMLWGENLESIKYRYPGDHGGERPGPVDLADADILEYEFTLVPGRADPGVVAVACECYEYQSCEHPGWAQSTARLWNAQLHTVAVEMRQHYNARFGPLDRDAIAHGLNFSSDGEAVRALGASAAGESSRRRLWLARRRAGTVMR